MGSSLPTKANVLLNQQVHRSVVRAASCRQWVCTWADRALLPRTPSFTSCQSASAWASLGSLIAQLADDLGQVARQVLVGAGADRFDEVAHNEQ